MGAEREMRPLSRQQRLPLLARRGVRFELDRPSLSLHPVGLALRTRLACSMLREFCLPSRSTPPGQEWQSLVYPCL